MFEPGYYWVVLKGKLTIAQYQPASPVGTQRPFPWYVIGELIGFETHEFTRVYKKRIEVPEEYV
jgi:hypothetical protein